MKNGFSVIVPTYNCAEFLPQCLDSILSQRVKNLELILVDDKSSDNSARIAKRTAQQHKNVFFHNIRSNQGVSVSRNIGLLNSRYKNIIFCDGDDVLGWDFAAWKIDDLYLGKMLDAKRQNPTSAMIVSDFCYTQKIIGGGGQKNEYLESLSKDLKFIKDFDAALLYLLERKSCWGILYDGAIIKDNNLSFDQKLRYSQDKDFVFRYAMAAKDKTPLLAFAKDAIYLYRVHDSGLIGVSKKNREKYKLYLDCGLLFYEFAHSQVTNILGKDSQTYKYIYTKLKSIKNCKARIK